MIWKTKDGFEYCGVADCYGRLIDSAGEEWREVCEARTILDMPLDNRRGAMAAIAKKRGFGDKIIEETIRLRLEHLLTVEWKWRKARKAEREAAAAA